MKSKKTALILKFIIASIFLFVGYKVATFENPLHITPTETAKPISEKGIEEVMSRAEFKKQQELLAKEIFLTEEKQRIEAELKAKIDSIEKQLEEVRSQKVSF